jgi:uncharacterized protein (TIGR02594 family)
MQITAFDLAHRFVGMKEVSGSLNNPAILAMLRLDNEWPTDDAVPWCSAFTNYVAWLLNLPRSKSLLARSWLVVGRAIELADARAGFDVVILRRSNNPLAGHVRSTAASTATRSRGTSRRCTCSAATRATACRSNRSRRRASSACGVCWRSRENTRARRAARGHGRAAGALPEPRRHRRAGRARARAGSWRRRRLRVHAARPGAPQ